jgi:hypothetical protein
MRGRSELSKVGLGIAVLALVALVVAGCSGSNTKTTAASKKPAATTPTTSITEAVVGHDGVKVLSGTATGQSPCELAAPTPASPGQVGGGGGGSESDATKGASAHGGERGMVQQKILTKSERLALEGQIKLARQVAVKYPTVKDALAAGYKKSTPFVPCIGAHYTDTGLVAKMDFGAPSELLYDGTEPNSKIVGLSYLVWHPGGTPPEGFAGKNDYWHQHNSNGGLCLKGVVVVGGEDMTRERCAAVGGRKTLLTDIWMLHAWIVPGFECSWGTFSGECPELGGRLCGTAWDSPDPNDRSRCAAALRGA